MDWQFWSSVHATVSRQSFSLCAKTTHSRICAIDGTNGIVGRVRVYRRIFQYYYFRFIRGCAREHLVPTRILAWHKLFATALVLTEFRQISPNEFIAKGIIAPLCAVVYVIVGAASFLQGGNTFYIWTIQSIAKMPVIVPLIAMVLGLTVMFGVYRFGKQQIQRKVGAHEITG